MIRETTTGASATLSRRWISIAAVTSAWMLAAVVGATPSGAAQQNVDTSIEPPVGVPSKVGGQVSRGSVGAQACMWEWWQGQAGTWDYTTYLFSCNGVDRAQVTLYDLDRSIPSRHKKYLDVCDLYPDSIGPQARIDTGDGKPFSRYDKNGSTGECGDSNSRYEIWYYIWKYRGIWGSMNDTPWTVVAW